MRLLAEAVEDGVTKVHRWQEQQCSSRNSDSTQQSKFFKWIGDGVDGDG
jgi:hypothetical protein